MPWQLRKLDHVLPSSPSSTLHLLLNGHALCCAAFSVVTTRSMTAHAQSASHAFLLLPGDPARGPQLAHAMHLLCAAGRHRGGRETPWGAPPPNAPQPAPLPQRCTISRRMCEPWEALTPPTAMAPRHHPSCRPTAQLNWLRGRQRTVPVASASERRGPDPPQARRALFAHCHPARGLFAAAAVPTALPTWPLLCCRATSCSHPPFCMQQSTREWPRPSVQLYFSSLPATPLHRCSAPPLQAGGGCCMTWKRCDGGKCRPCATCCMR